MVFTVVLVKPWTPEKISGMLIVSQPIRCEMKPQKITAKPQQASVTTWYETTSWPFLLREVFNFSFLSLWKSYFLTQSNTSHLIPSVQKPNYRIDLKVKIYNGTGSRHFSATKKYGSKTTNHSQLARPFELHVKQTQRNIACDWLNFSRPQTRCLAVSNRLILSSWFSIAFP